MRIAVTGATGFLGRYVVRHFGGEARLEETVRRLLEN